MAEFKMRALGIAMEIIEKTDLQVTYNYDDLIFVDKNMFIIQFDDNKDKNLKLHFNNDITTDVEKIILKKLETAAKEFNYTITQEGYYLMDGSEDEEKIQLNFIKEKKKTE